MLMLLQEMNGRVLGMICKLKFSIQTHFCKRGETKNVEIEKDIGAFFKILESEGNCVEKRTEGIYYISGRFPFAIQVIVSKELNKKEYLWLTSLTERLSLNEAEEIVKEASKLSAKEDKECSESVLQVVMSRNTDIFDKIKEVPTVFEALAQLMKPEIDKMIAEANAEKDAVIAQKEAENKKALEYIKELEAKLALAKVQQKRNIYLCNCS